MYLYKNHMFPWLMSPRYSSLCKSGRSSGSSKRGGSRSRQRANATQTGDTPSEAKKSSSSTNNNTNNQTELSEEEKEAQRKLKEFDAEQSFEAEQIRQAQREQQRAWDEEMQMLRDLNELSDDAFIERYGYSKAELRTKDYDNPANDYTVDVNPDTIKETINATNNNAKKTSNEQINVFEGAAADAEASKNSKKSKNSKNKDVFSTVQKKLLRFYDDKALSKPQLSFTPLSFDLPFWGIEDYINDIAHWQKGVGSITDEPGFFYFKVFFKFDTNFGLFGGMLNEPGQVNFAGNCAKRFFSEISHGYIPERPVDRLVALDKFCKLFSTINRTCPWIIKAVNNIGSTFKRLTEQEDLENERKIDLIFNFESVDMRILNLLHLYRYICYDDINMKEVLPVNLRKFDMMIVLYHMPIKYFQTGVMIAEKTDMVSPAQTWIPSNILNKSASKKYDISLGNAIKITQNTFNFLTSQSKYFKYKRLHPENGDFTNMMSFHMITLQDCEFDVNSFDNYFSSGEFNNENPFQIQDISIGIKYGRAFHHTMNEWNQFMFGSDGFHFNTIPNKEEDKRVAEGQKRLHKKRLDAIAAARDIPIFDGSAGQYSPIVDYCESVVTNGLMSMSMENYYKFEGGNIYGDVGYGSDYWNYKMKYNTSIGNFGNIFGYGLSPSTSVNKKTYFYSKFINNKNQVKVDRVRAQTYMEAISQAGYRPPKMKDPRQWLMEHQNRKSKGVNDVLNIAGAFYKTNWSNVLGI